MHSGLLEFEDTQTQQTTKMRQQQREMQTLRIRNTIMHM